MPTIADQSRQLYLSKATNHLADSLSHAKQRLSRHQALIQSFSQSSNTAHEALHRAIEKVKDIRYDLETPVTSVDASKSRGESVGACSKMIGSAVAKLLMFASQVAMSLLCLVVCGCFSCCRHSPQHNRNHH